MRRGEQGRGHTERSGAGNISLVFAPAALCGFCPVPPILLGYLWSKDHESDEKGERHSCR